MPSALPRTRWALAPPFHPYPNDRRFAPAVSRKACAFRGLIGAIARFRASAGRQGGMFLLRCLSRKPGSPCGALSFRARVLTGVAL